MPAERDSGLQALQRGDFNAAVQLLETACQQNPSDFDAHLYLGAAYGQVGRQMDAITTITRAVQLDPSSAQARYNLGVAMEQAGYREQAIQAIQQAITLQPDYAKAQETLNRLQGGAGAAPPVAQPPPTAYGTPVAEPSSGSNLPQFGFGQAQAPAQQPSSGYQSPPVYTPPTNAGYAPPTGYAQPQAPQQAGYGQETPSNPYGQPGQAAPPAGYGQPTSAYTPPPAPYTPPANSWAPPAGTNAYGTPLAGSPGYAPAIAPVYGGFWIRFVAAFIDGLVMMIPVLICSGIAGFMIGMAMSGQPTEAIQAVAQFVGIAVQLLVQWPYFALMESSPKQATFGKQAMGLIVTDTNGGRLNFGQASVRYWSKLLSGLVLAIGYIMAAFDPQKRALHDRIANTLVVKR